MATNFIAAATKYRIEKSCHSLSGILQGIAIDSRINDLELSYLNAWIDEHKDVAHRHPFNELIPVVKTAISDGIIDEGEKSDILWLCNKLSSENDYYNEITASIQHLQGLMTGILSDGMITKDELDGLMEWIDDHSYLQTCWPYDEINAVVTSVLRDKKIDEDEHALLISCFSDFSQIEDDRTITNPIVEINGSLTGVCAMCPEIVFENKSFCFTGASSVKSRNELSDIVKALKGQVKTNVSTGLDYLIIGSAGNPCWAYACYGRKVEQAVSLRKRGNQILIVHENDFHDAVFNLA